MIALEHVPASALHVAIDMQRLFAEPTDWHTPGLSTILPAVARLTAAKPRQTLFARFTVPSHPEAATGRWKAYYRRWSGVTGDKLAAGMLDLVEPLAALAADGSTFDKTTYSIFGSPVFEARLGQSAVDTLILTGVETDICVLASIFGAVDRGFRVIVPWDAVASSAEDAHETVLGRVISRIPEQVEITTVDDILHAWS